jgi:hypothetical protein
MKYQPTPDSPGKIAFDPRKAGSNIDLIKEQNDRDRRDMEVVKATMDQNSETAKRNARNQEFNNRMKDKEFEKLMSFSKSAMELITAENKKKNDNEMQEGIAMAYTEGIGEEAEQGLEAFEAQLTADDRETQAAGGLAFDQTGNYEVSSRVKNLSGWRQYGYQQGMAQRAGEEYSGYVQAAMENDTTTEITVDGRTFTPATANGAAEVQAAMAAVRNNFVKEYGLIGTDVAVLNKYAFPSMRKAESALSQEFNARFAADESYAEQQEAKSTFVADGNYGALVQRLTNTLDASGKRLGNRGAHKMAKEYLSEAIANGNITEDQAKEIAKQPVPWDKKGRTFEDLYPNLVTDAIRDANKFDRAEAKLEQEALQAAFDARETELYQAVVADPGKFTRDDIEGWQAEFADKFGKRSSKLDDAAKSYSANAVQQEEQRKFLLDLQSTGRLMPRHLKGIHPEVAQQFAGMAQNNKQARGKNGNFTASLNSIAATVKKARQDTTGENGALIPTQMIIADLQDKFLTQVAANIANRIPNPEAQALNDIRSHFIEEGGTPENPNDEGKYYYDADGGRDNYLRHIQNQSKDYEDTVSNAIQLVGTVGTKKALASPGLIFNEKQLLEMEETYGQPDFQVPAIASYLGQKLNVDAFQIINEQREALKMKPLDSPSASIVEGMTPAGKELLRRFRSQNRSIRAMSSELGRWVPEMNEYGVLIEQHAQKYGMEPAHIAAMIEIESGGDASNVSYNESSFGLMQINKDAHPLFFSGGDWKDPSYNIEYGTQYFSQMMEMYGGNVEHAAMAYNGGPGNLDKYLDGTLPNGDVKTEMVNHARKFMKALARHNRQALNSPLSRRGEFKVQQIVSTDPRYANDNDPKTLYDPAGHGGDAMHQHYEFATKQMAAMAKALYESKGFRVTSYLRPHDEGSAHQHGYAIDVAPPLDLARNDQAEMDWIDTANAVIGY